MDLTYQRNRNLDQELLASTLIQQKCQSNKTYSQNLYAALCNVSWYSDDIFDCLAVPGWSCTWRRAGATVAEIRDQGETYLDWYCSGMLDQSSGAVIEGVVTDEIQKDLASLGWRPVTDPYLGL